MVYMDNRDKQFMKLAIDESRKCTPDHTSYCVGAVVVTSSGEVFTGYTHETCPKNHAEEEAVSKALSAGAILKGGTIYSSMEPCTNRKSKPVSCTRLIIVHGFSRVVYALPEPPDLAECHGREILEAAGIAVGMMPEMGFAVEEINSHILRHK